jgi:recombinational DNA repair protein (RecF pathway)
MKHFTCGREYQKFLTQCSFCGGNTSKAYARKNNGMCKNCAHPSEQAPTREERILEHGYQAYAREEGHYDVFEGNE